MNPNTTWPDDEVEQLRKLFAAGLSGGDIAKGLSGRSRNAVIGKLRRIGLKLSPKAKTGRPIKPRQPRKRSSKNYRSAPWKPNVIEQFPATQAVDLPPEPAANPVTLMQLTLDHCRWPVAGEGADTMFCGGDKLDGHSYCRRHCDMAYSRQINLTRAELELRMRHMAKTRAATRVA